MRKLNRRDLSPIGVVIKQGLVATGKTQYELAKEVGTSTNYIYLIMIGERSGVSFLPKIAEALGIENLQSA